MHMDSLRKILNHLLMVMMMCNIFLFVASWNVSFLPIMGFNTVLVAFFLCFQNIVVWLILNNNRISALSFLAPTDFMVGVSLGITVGGAILSFVISSAYRHMSRCDAVQPIPVYEYVCAERKSSMAGIWFWSGLVFWLNFCSSLLLAIGRDELTQQNHYENIGLSMDDYEGHFHQHHQQEHGRNDFLGDAMSGIPPFVGDYSTVPEIRSAMEEAERRASNNKPSVEKAYIQQV
jgi:hypothetical protein